MDGYLRLSYWRDDQEIMEASSDQVGARSRRPQRAVPGATASGEGLGYEPLPRRRLPRRSSRRGRSRACRAENHGLTHLRRVYWNLPAPAPVEAIHRSEGHMAQWGRSCGHGQAHGPRGRRQVRRARALDEGTCGGAKYNASTPESFSALHARLCGYLQGRDVFVQDVYGGADREHASAVRNLTQKAWHSLFARTMSPRTRHRGGAQARPRLHDHRGPGFQASPMADGTGRRVSSSSTSARSSDHRRHRLRGEIKKTVFTVLNYCSARRRALHALLRERGPRGRRRRLLRVRARARRPCPPDPAPLPVGDDEHGWGTSGAQLRGGCYAKRIRLSPEAEPQIHATTAASGRSSRTRVRPGLRIWTERRAPDREHARAYPLDFIANAVPRSGGTPRNVVS